MAERLFIFIQMEFPWALGPPDGRYLLRAGADGEAEHVVVLGTLAAGRQRAGGAAAPGRRPSMLQRRRSRGRGMGRRATPEPAPVPTARVTVIDPVPLGAEHQARAWLAELDRDRDVHAAVVVINRMLHLHRIAAAALFIGAGTFVEFWWFGVASCVAAWAYCHRPTAGRALLWVLATASLGVVNGNLWTLALEFFVRGGRGIAAHGYEFRRDADGNLFRR